MATNTQRIEIIEKQQALIVRAMAEHANGAPPHELKKWLEAVSPGVMEEMDPKVDAPAPSPEPIRSIGMLPVRAGAQPYPTRQMTGIDGVTIHYTAGSPLASVRDIAAYQTGANSHLPFPAIAYHLVVDHAGNVYRCHDLNVRVWHNGAVVNGKARNDTHIAVCWVGNHTPTQGQIDGMRGAIRWCRYMLGGRTLAVEGHGDSSSTACPGPTWQEWRSRLL